MALLLIGLPVASSCLAAAAARRQSLVSTLLLAYLCLVANLAVTTLALSPLADVTRGWLALTQTGWLAASVAVWSARGRPRPPLAAATTACREVLGDPLSALFVAGGVAVLAYELALGLTVPPNELDELTYHLARAAAWAEHGGIYWIAYAPTVRMNAFQPLAEQLDLYLMVASGGGALFAIPQFVAEIAILVSVYGASRRLGFAVRASVCGAALVSTFSLVALEATTAQNDLVAASFVAVAACLLLGDGHLDAAAGGAAAAFGLGTKLSVGPVLPILAVLALTRGRRSLVTALVGGAAGLVSVGMWGYVLNLLHTGHVLGAGTAAAEDRASPSFPGSVANFFDYLYGLMDLSVLSNRLIELLALTGAAAAGAVALVGAQTRRLRRAGATAAGTALPFVAPLLVLGAAGVLAFIAARCGLPIRGPKGVIGPADFNLFEYDRIANEDYSAFGPVGIVALVAAIALTVVASRRGRRDVRQLVLAAALPGYLLYVSLATTWSPYLTRFFLVPAVLVAPLLARLFRGPAETAAYLAVASVVVALTITQDQTKPLDSRYFGRPWDMTQLTALDANAHAYVATALADFDALVPARACVGAVLGFNDPSYLLYGSRLEHRVDYLPSVDPLALAEHDRLSYVVISNWYESGVAATFRAGGWRVRSLGSFWLLASAPGARGGTCTSGGEGSARA